jgi:lysophospholipase L1-like esterase
MDHPRSSAVLPVGMARLTIRRSVLAMSALAGAPAAVPRRAATEMMMHVVLLGDSVFDNGAYVAGGPDVAAQLREILPEDWRATLLAQDGAVIDGVQRQLERLPADTSHLVISAGGNDALREAGLLEESARSVAEALDRLAGVAERFGGRYAAMLDRAREHGLPLAVCTIYDGRLPDPRRRRIAVTALTVLNDRITREAFARRLPLIDLRLICDSDEDYANPIEPSVQGGRKIAAAIAALVTEHAFGGSRSTVFNR